MFVTTPTKGRHLTEAAFFVVEYLDATRTKAASVLDSLCDQPRSQSGQ
jgi:hypothetical protein